MSDSADSAGYDACDANTDLAATTWRSLS